ncbi:hypothetical protein Cni_G13480 [Canna indica]|uniref:DUF3741 domain-containing protein n=1 Tax=Canna indica TaxID=4628 RepID=A0AAQ3K9L3_9LILI|nr:hypothetical protein Cni_G13480 [Canna indica]
MHQSRRPRCREDPAAAAEFRRHRVSTSPAPAEGHLRCKKQSNASSAAFDSACNIGLSAEQDFIARYVSHGSSRKTGEIPIKELIDEEVSKAKEIRRSSPSLIARLMGLDVFPSIGKQKKLQEKHMDNCCKITSSVGLSGSFAHPEDCSQWTKHEKQDFKDVFEVTETSKSTKHKYNSDRRGILGYRRREDDENIARQRLMDTKCLSPDEMLQKSKEFIDEVEVEYSSKDLFLELLQDPNSLFSKHVQDLTREPSSPHGSNITILKQCKGSKNSSNKVQCKSLNTEKKHDPCFHMQQEVPGSFKTHMASLDRCYAEESSISRSSLASSYVARPKACVQPAHIVILKPSIENARKMAEPIFLTHGNLQISSKKAREIAASRIQEFHVEGRNKQKLSYYTEVLDHKLISPKQIAREIKRKTRHNISRLNKRSFTPVTSGYHGTGDSFIMPGIIKLIHSNVISQSFDPLGEQSKKFSPSSYSTEPYVCRGAQNHSSVRWNSTNQFRNMGFMSNGSSTRNEVFVVSDTETPKFTVDLLNTKNILVSKLAVDDEAHSSKDGHRDGSSRFSPRSKSFAALCSPKLGNRKRGGGCNTTVIKDAPDMGPSFSSDANLIMPIPIVKSFEHQDHRYQLTNSLEEEDMLPEREIHVNSDGLTKRFDMNDSSANSRIHPGSTDRAISIRYQLTDSTMNSILGGEVWHLATQEEQVMQSAFPVPSEDKRLTAYIQNKIVTQEKCSDRPQVKLLVSESDMTKSHSLGSEDHEHPSPVSVLETPSEDETYSSGCFERLSADLKELRMQLEQLKAESAAINTEAGDGEVLMLSNEGSAGVNCMLQPLGESHQRLENDDDRDFSYLLDILVESGIHRIDDNKLANACCLLGCPLNQSVFIKLEKRYNRVASWSRSERRLLFDIINSTLADLVSSYMDVHLRATWKMGVGESLVEFLWQMAMQPRKQDTGTQVACLGR